ncbi:MAG: hypothetical protein JWP45_2194 [Mucilaginibacter sp.]|nr:hypothetical protein [Mucilaginibacter sp.]
MYLPVLLFYSIWFLCTCIKQFKYKWPDSYRRYYLFNQIPSWNFFSPNPGVSDMNLLRRFRLKNGEISEFEEILFRASSSKNIHFFWNPKRRLNKTLVDHTKIISKTIERENLDNGNLEDLKLSFSYLSLLNYCSKLPTNLEAEAVQLIIIESFGYVSTLQPRLILNSDFHKI